MMLNLNQHTVLELLRIHLIKDDEGKIYTNHDSVIEMIEEILIKDEI